MAYFWLIFQETDGIFTDSFFYNSVIPRLRDIKTSKESEYPISNKECPMSEERKYDLQERLIDYAV